MRQWYLIMRAQEKIEEKRWAPHASQMALYVQGKAKPGKKYVPADFNPFVKKHEENEGIKTKEDVLALMDRLK